MAWHPVSGTRRVYEGGGSFCITCIASGRVAHALLGHRVRDVGVHSIQCKHSNAHIIGGVHRNVNPVLTLYYSNYPSTPCLHSTCRSTVIYRHKAVQAIPETADEA